MNESTRRERYLEVALSDDLARSLHAFCEVHFGANPTRVIEEAVRSYIDYRLQQDPIANAKFSRLKRPNLRIVSEDVADK